MNGFLIKKLRKRLGLTQEQFAQKVGVSFTTVNRWEKREDEEPSPLGKLRLKRVMEEAGIDLEKFERQREK